MAVTPRIEIKQSQSLLMTPQLRQAINLLQLNNLELKELVEQELNANPLLEREEDSLCDIPEKLEQTIDDYNSPSEEEIFQEDIDYDNAFNDDFGSDREGYEPSWDNYSSSTRKNDSDDNFDYIEQRLSSSKSIYELLDEQISQNFTDAKDKLVAFRMLDFLDPAGYFTQDLNLLSQKLNLSLEYIQKILQTLQTFEPSGIFATSLQECLRLQLAEQNRLDPMMNILLQHLELLAQGEIKQLQKLCHATDEDMQSMLADIKSLNPKPLAGYGYEPNNYIIPDVYVRRTKYGEYKVELNHDSLPRVLINQKYACSINSSNKNDKKYIREQLSNASFLVKALHQRATTILRVSEEIVKIQRDFLEYGISHLKPMLLRDIAEALEMHESTVSRVTNHKYIHTPSGTFELKYFFSSAAGMYNGNTSTSTISIKHLIKKLISEEGSNILSDDALVNILAEHSIKIARRTVAKYRDEMGIPTSAQRKRAYRHPKL